MKKSAAEAHRMLSNTYGEAAISERTCREWFQRIKNGDFDVDISMAFGGTSSARNKLNASELIKEELIQLTEGAVSCIIKLVPDLSCYWASIPQGQTFYFCCNFPRTRNRVHKTSLPHQAIASSFPSTHNSSGCLIQALKMTAFAVVFLIGISLLGCDCRPDGAPKTACSSLTPVHSGIKPQRESPPYTVSVTKNGNKVRGKHF
ncbi:hypothetical protein TNCV_38401 [Trichonephila clavipes]|nr:hypothetical protein TNCV_38401 [Trichonephila clavipes]